jgi:N-methylhydantoinase A/oxoprolinase/acetone carboxylase beta subunit
MRALGIDVGGTFTDFVLFDADTKDSRVLKLSSGVDTAATVIKGIRDITEQAGLEPSDVDLLIHGTTVATNALLEYDGAEAGMITTEGFRDVTHIGRHQRPQNYSIQQDIPWQVRPLVKRRHRHAVPERLVPPLGDVLVELDRGATRRAAEALSEAGVEAVSVCFLFSYLNPEHEREAAEIVRDVMPDAYVCTSHEVVPQFREFERFTTTAINAFVGPKVKRYIQKLDREIRAAGVGSALHVMQSNGGTATAEVASERPVTLLLSGPVGGVMGGIWSAERDRRHLATLDVGGTSADIGIVTEDGLVEARSRDTWIAGYPVMVPMIDIETIGAGGGSVAYIDRAGALHVGPRSAGSQPGPAAYQRGGIEPTVTDANVVLGRLPQSLAGGLELSRELAENAIEPVAEALGLSVAETAAGIIRIVNENMAAALRTKTIERGLDPRDFLLSAFGGGGPAQGAELAAILDIPQVIIPPNPGVTSAAGLLTSDLRYDISQSYLARLEEVEAGDLRARFEQQERVLRERLRGDGQRDDEIHVEWAADLRYHGQSYELKIAILSKDLGDDTGAQLQRAFHEGHEREFGHHFPEYDVELVNLRLTGTGTLPHLTHGEVTGATLDEARVDRVEVGFADGSGAVQMLDTDVYERLLLPVDEDISGPAIVVQLDSTTLVPPDCTVRRDRINNLLITVGQR